MKIPLTEKHITNGLPRNGSYCPMALAICEALRFTVDVKVGKYSTGIAPLRGDVDYSIFNPGVVQDFIEDFDNGKHVQPMIVDFPIPDALLPKEPERATSCPDTSKQELSTKEGDCSQLVVSHL